MDNTLFELCRRIVPPNEVPYYCMDKVFATEHKAVVNFTVNNDNGTAYYSPFNIWFHNAAVAHKVFKLDGNRKEGTSLSELHGKIILDVEITTLDYPGMTIQLNLNMMNLFLTYDAIILLKVIQANGNTINPLKFLNCNSNTDKLNRCYVYNNKPILLKFSYIEGNYILPTMYIRYIEIIKYAELLPVEIMYTDTIIHSYRKIKKIIISNRWNHASVEISGKSLRYACTNYLGIQAEGWYYLSTYKQVLPQLNIYCIINQKSIKIIYDGAEEDYAATLYFLRPRFYKS